MSGSGDACDTADEAGSEGQWCDCDAFPSAWDGRFNLVMGRRYLHLPTRAAGTTVG